MRAFVIVDAGGRTRFRCTQSCASSITLAACSNAFDGCQPTFKHTPPKTAAFDQRDLSPRSAARNAACSHPPDPITISRARRRTCCCRKRRRGGAALPVCGCRAVRMPGALEYGSLAALTFESRARVERTTPRAWPEAARAGAAPPSR